MESPHRKSLLRSWRRLSRFQRNLIYFGVALSVVTGLYVAFSSEASGLPPAVVTEGDLEAHLGLEVEEEESRNRVEAVQKVLNRQVPKEVCNQVPRTT